VRPAPGRRRAVEKLLTTNLTSTDTTEREAMSPWTRSRRARRRRSGTRARGWFWGSRVEDLGRPGGREGRHELCPGASITPSSVTNSDAISLRIESSARFWIACTAKNSSNTVDLRAEHRDPLQVVHRPILVRRRCRPARSPFFLGVGLRVHRVDRLDAELPCWRPGARGGDRKDARRVRSHGQAEGLRRARGRSRDHGTGVGSNTAVQGWGECRLDRASVHATRRSHRGRRYQS
jgi:hypothetical protein